MLQKLIGKRNKDEGFTIIEVLIVLAIAGLILVVVLIAIPQLQRNQRNTARQNDASRVATAISNWVANNNGAIPTSSAVANVKADIGDLSQYDLSSASSLTIGPLSTPPAGNNSLTLLEVETGATCGASGVPAAGTPRQFVVLYATETSAGGSTGTPACVDV